MNHDTKHPPLPSLVGTVLTDGNHYIDNLLAAAWKTLRLNQLLLCAGFSKRHGIEVTETVFVLMVWKWLNVSSVAMFCRNALGMFSRAKKDVLYDFLKREDIDWRKFNMGTAKEVYRQQGLGDSRVKAFVLDDSVKARRGKKMEGVSSHYDHVTSRHVMGQQVLTLGLATDDAFLPLDSQLYVSRTKAQALNRSYEGWPECRGSEVPGGDDPGQAGDGRRDDETSEAQRCGRGLPGGRCVVWYEDDDSGGE